MTIDRGNAVYSACMDTAATSAQVAAIQGLFDEIGLTADVTADYNAKSIAAGALNAVMYLIGAGVATAFMRSAAAFGGSFGKGVGDKLGPYAGERIKEWLSRTKEVRGRELTTIVQDSSLRTEIILTGDEPPEALQQLKELIENGKIGEIPGRAALVSYREGEGWVRPF